MTTLTRPTWLKPNQCTLALRKSGLQFVSPFNGTLQAVETLAERWAMSLNMPASVAGVSRSAFFNQWAGGVNLVPLYNFGRPQPLGTLRGAPTLATATARGDTSLALAGCIGTNKLLGGSFEVDSNADGLADGWTRYSAGTVGALTHSRSTSIVWEAAYSQNLVAASLGPTDADRQGITRDITTIAGLVGGAVTYSCRLLGTAGTRVTIELYWRDSGGTILGSIASVPLVLNGDYQAIAATGTCPVGAVSASLYLYQHTAPAGAVGLYLDLVRIEAGLSATSGGYATLLADDMISDGTQLYQVAADCTATDAGTMTVPVVNRSRGAVASGTVVLWDRPTALFALPAMEQSTTWLRGGQVDGLVLDAIEVY